MIESIARDGTKVVLRIKTGLNITANVLIFKWGTESEMFAELLKNQLINQLEEFKEEISRKPYYHLDPKEISKLKSKLVKEWDGGKHCWKWGIEWKIKSKN